jgi:hypothetical protein
MNFRKASKVLLDRTAASMVLLSKVFQLIP